MTDQEREEFRAFMASPKNLERFREFMATVDPNDPRHRTRLQVLLDMLRAEANEPTHPNQAEAAKMLADWEAACRAEN